MGYIKSFSTWLNEKTCISDNDTDGIDLKDNIEIEDSENEYIAKKSSTCPRCGKIFPCDCQEKEPMDINITGRFKGKIKNKK